jgi:hypothetical protein
MQTSKGNQKRGDYLKVRNWDTRTSFHHGDSTRTSH